MFGTVSTLAFGGWIISRYKRCPSNQLLIISGKTFGTSGKSSKQLHGGGAFVWPIIQESTFLSLEPLALDIDLRGALSLEKIRVNVPCVFTVGVGTTELLMENAARRLVGLHTPDIAHLAEEIVVGQLRQVIASMQIDEINRDRDSFMEKITNQVDHEVHKIGLELINVNIRDLTDDSGYIEQLSKRATAITVEKARVDVAEQEKLGAIGTETNYKDMQVEVAKQRTIKEVEVSKLEAQQIQGTNEQKMAIAQSNNETLIATSESDRLGATASVTAEAAIEEARYRAQAKAALARAEQVEAEKRAEVEAPAKALKAEAIVQAEAEAEAQKIRARGEGESLFAIKEAEARGEFEMLAKKAAGLELVVKGCGGSKEAFQLLMLEHLDTLAESSAKAVSNIKFDKVVVWDSGNGADGSNATSNFIRGMASALPPTMDIMKHVAGVDLPQYFGSLPGKYPGDGAATENDGADSKPKV